MPCNFEKKKKKKIGIFSKCKQLPEIYAKESSRLYQKYRPIEIDPNLSIEVKTEAMREWMIAAEEILKGIPFTPDEIPEISNIYGTHLRDGTKEFFKKLHFVKIPVLVFSAGLGDIVEAILKNQGVLFDNVKVTVNTYNFLYRFIFFAFSKLVVTMAERIYSEL